MAENSKFTYLPGSEVEPLVHKAGYVDQMPLPLHGDDTKVTPNDPRHIAHTNYRELRKEFYRDHKAMGVWAFIENPFVPLGFGAVVWSFVQAGLAKNEMKRFTFLSWRVHAQAFTVFAIFGGFAYQQYKEDKWIKRTAKERDLPLNKEDFSF